jgi:hypothetical protein
MFHNWNENDQYMYEKEDEVQAGIQGKYGAEHQAYGKQEGPQPANDLVGEEAKAKALFPIEQ